MAIRSLTETSTVTAVTEVRSASFGAGYRAPSLKRTSCCDYFSSWSVVSRAFCALCVYLKFRHHLHPLGYLLCQISFLSRPPLMS